MGLNRRVQRKSTNKASANKALKEIEKVWLEAVGEFKQSGIALSKSATTLSKMELPDSIKVRYGSKYGAAISTYNELVTKVDTVDTVSGDLATLQNMDSLIFEMHQINMERISIFEEFTSEITDAMTTAKERADEQN